ACTHTTFSPNIAHGGQKVNVVPDRVEIDVDIRALPGVSPADVDRMLGEAIGDLGARVEVQRLCGDEGSMSSMETPLADALTRAATALVPGSHVVPRLMAGATDARYFRWKGVAAYGFALHSPRISQSDYALMFHGNNERVDVESLGLTARLW